MKMSETSEVNNIVSCDEASEQYVQSSKSDKFLNCVCVSCSNKSLINPSVSLDLNCLSCSTLSNSDTIGNNQHWCHICSNLASQDCRAANHNIESYNDYFHAQLILIKSNVNRSNLACDEELSDCQKTQSALQAIIAWIKVLQLEKTQSDSSSIGASFLCQVLISQLESLKTAGVFHVAEKDGSGILNYINQLTTHFSDRYTQIRAAQTKVRKLLDKCSFLQETNQTSQFSNNEPSPDLANRITMALSNTKKSCVDVLISLMKEEPKLEIAPELDFRNSETDNLEHGRIVEVKIDETDNSREPLLIKTSCSSNQRYPKRQAEHESKSDTVKIRKKSRGVPNVGFLNRETDDNQHVRTSPFTFDKETRRYPLPTLLVESIIKEDSRVIGSGIGSVDSYFNKFNKTRSELSQNLQEAQIKLKILEEETILFANETAILPEKMAKRITELEADVASMVENVKLAKESEAKARKEASGLLKHAKEVQERYENELIQHTSDVGQLNAVREEMDQLEQRYSALEIRFALLQQASMQQETEFSSERTSWQAQKELVEKAIFEKAQRSAKRKKLIEALQKQITSLNSRIAAATRSQEVVSRAPNGENAGLPFAYSEDDKNQPLKLVHCFRQEKDVAVARCGVLETELQSLKTELEEMKRQSIEIQATLSQEREERKVLINSHRLLKDERDGLDDRVEELAVKVSSLLSEIGSLKNIDLQSSCDLKKLSEKNRILRSQISRWKTKSLLQAKLELKFDEQFDSEADRANQLQQVAIYYKTQYENLKIQQEKSVEEHEGICTAQSTRIQELEASIVKINVEMEEFKKKNLIQEKLRTKVRRFVKERNLSNPNQNTIPQLVPINVTSSPTSSSVTFSDDPLNKNREQLQLYSSVEETNSSSVVEFHPTLGSVESSHREAANEETVDQQSFNLLREFEVFIHAQKCQRGGKGSDGKCTVRFCHPLKIILKHSTSQCHTGELCPVPDCWFSLAYQSDEVFNKITRLESDLLFMAEQAELAEESEAVAYQEASNQAKRAMEDRENYEIKLLQRTAENERLNIVLEQSRSQLAIALEELAGRATPDEIRSLQSHKEIVQTQLEQIQKEVEHIKQNNIIEKKELEELVRVAEEEISNLLSQEKKHQTLQEQMKQSQTKLVVQLTESQEINTQLETGNQELERKLRTAKEVIKKLLSRKDSIQMQLERLKQSNTSLTKRLENSQQIDKTQQLAIKELEERNCAAKEEVRKMESEKDLLQTQLEKIKQSQTKLTVQLTEYQQKNMQLNEANVELEDRVSLAKDESQKLLSEKNSLHEKLGKTVDEVTELRQMAVKYDGLKICYNERKLEHEKVFQENEKLLQQITQLTTQLEETKKEYQSEERLRKKPRLETIEENQNQSKMHQQDQQTVSVNSTLTASILKSCNKVVNQNPKPKPVSPTLRAVPSADVVPSVGGSGESVKNGKELVFVESEDNERSRRLFITRHCILNHARKCLLRKSNSKAKCHVPLCLESSAVLNHIRKCRAGASCQRPHCLSSKRIICYWKTCNRAHCPLCYNKMSQYQYKDTCGVAGSEIAVTEIETSCSPLQQVTGGQFCSTKRFEFLAMAMLTQLHNNGANQFVYPCNYCKMQVETRFRCSVCSSPDFDFELCILCYRKNGHRHQMDEMGFSLDFDSSNSNNSKETGPIQRGIQSLVHSLECLDANCYFLFCQRMKIIVNHMHSCETSGCSICYQLVALIICHAKHNCYTTKFSTDCTVPFCKFLIRRIASSANMSIQSAFRNLADPIRSKDSGSEIWIDDTLNYTSNSMDVLPHQQKKIGKTSTKIVNPQLILPSEICKYSEYGIY